MRSFFLSLALCAGCCSAWAANPQALRLSHDADTLRVDGKLDEAAWLRAPLFDQFVQYQPEDKKPAAWRTTVQILVTHDALIFGIRAYDPAPEQIRAPLKRRDTVARDQDFVSVVLDPVGHRRSAQFARVSAAGVVGDGMFTAESDGEDFAPDFEVEAAAQRLSDGYSVELRWPLASLRYPYSEGLPWRLMVARNIPRQEANTLNVSAPLTKEALSFIAELQPIEGLGDMVEQVRERSFLSVRPELTLRRREDSEPGHPSTSKRESNFGAELKWRPRADWVIDAVLNPDFSQVELDAPQLSGNTRFALSLPEKRPFFLESTDVVGQTKADDQGQNRSLAAFYSRAITDPDWGVRSTWRGASADATALSLHDAGGGQVLRPHAYGTDSFAQPRDSQASFARGRMQVSGLNLGLLASDRNYGQGQYNRVAGSDFSWSASDVDRVRGHLLLSSTRTRLDPDAAGLSPEAEQGHHLWLGWRRRTEQWNTEFNVEDVGPRFANDNGFVSQAGYRRGSLHLIRRLSQDSLAPLGEWSRFPTYELELDFKLAQASTVKDELHGVPGGELIERRVQPGFWIATARNTGIWGHLGLDQLRAKTGGRLHEPRTLTLGFESNPHPILAFVSAELEWGRRLDVEADRLGRGANFWMLAKLRVPMPAGLGLEVEQQWSEGFVNGANRGRSFTDKYRQTLAVLHWSARDSLRLIAQSTHFQRQGEVGLEASAFSGRHTSLMYQHRVGLARVFSLGMTRFDDSPGRKRSTEIFAKAQVAWQP
ncbi:carbohydrate binding family 9 domain-containing protein [Paucibacter sp. DJ2R-2]|uniref:carbohydrate binding family 9 domain-containing protein n=1 Tax=Paucibacter sp. DJ2R-2 TaxID=2893558 RepID=UPI0021E3A549|nr:carbohydrate binding family 9 domain-containing protein [Paucibacter sp. DJ2R-2]MCV2419501.1 carbohydrate binding family 9 domain-containing protein [Paucibacter sp. DJ4R-1]MCV2437596.1 carbohydrate binding family 9 domain-containing protein [Paucibacter sp. DJ2R-2]